MTRTVDFDNKEHLLGEGVAMPPIPEWLRRRDCMHRKTSLSETASANEPAHSPVGASGAHRWFRCPGSVQLCASLPSDSGSEFAREGTAAHEVAADCLREGSDAWEYIGQKVVVEGQEFEVNEEMEAAVQTYVDHVRYDLSVYRDETGEEPILMVERRFVLRHIDEQAFGTSDAVLIFPRWCQMIVYDFKYGRGVQVFAENNPQLKYYAAGVIYELNGEYDVTDVELVVSQPRISGMPSSWVTTVDELGEWTETELRAAVERTRDPEAPLVPGPEQCQFCPAMRQAACPEVAGWFNEAAQQAEEGVEPGGLEDFEIAAMYDRAPVLKKFIQGIEEEAFRRLMEGHELPGYKLVAKEGWRVWKDGAEEAIKAALGDRVYETTLRSPAQIEGFKGGKELAAEWAYKPRTGLTVAPDSDTREAVRAKDPAEVFAGVK